MELTYWKAAVFPALLIAFC